MALTIMSGLLNPPQTDNSRKRSEGADEDSVTRQKTALSQSGDDPVRSSRRRAAVTVKSVGLAPAATFSCSGYAPVWAPCLLEKLSKTSRETQAGWGWREPWRRGGSGGHSGCTRERLQDQFQQTVHTSDDDCTDSAQSMQGRDKVGGETDCVAIYQPKGWGG